MKIDDIYMELKLNHPNSDESIYWIEGKAFEDMVLSYFKEHHELGELDEPICDKTTVESIEFTFSPARLVFTRNAAESHQSPDRPS